MKASISIIHVAFKLSLGLIAMLLGLSIVAQDFKSLDELDEGQTEIGITSEKFQHHHMALSFGFETSESYIKTETSTKRLNVPVIGLNYNYWIDNGLGVGLKGTIGLSEYQITNGDTNSVKRNYPVLLSPQMLLNPAFGLMIFMGPGIEIDRNENLFVFNLGIGYSMIVWNQFDVTPEIFYLFKESAVGAYGINVKLGLVFGK